MAESAKTIPTTEPVDLISCGAVKRAARSRAGYVAAALCPALMSLTLPLLIAGCLSFSALAVALATAACAAAALGVFSCVRSSSVIAPIAGALVAGALAVALAVPGAREGLFSVCNGVISSYDDLFGAYVPLISQAALVAGDAVFAACLGLVSAVLAWFISRFRSTGATMLILVALCSVATRLSLGFCLAGSCLGVAGWLMQCRWQQLRGSTYSAGALAMSMGVGIVGCCGIFLACAMLWSPSAAIEKAHGALKSAVDVVRFGEGSTPEGDLYAATSMNEGEGELSVRFSEPASNDVLLRGFVGATYEDGVWEPLDHTAYEGDWAHMTSWLASEGVPCAAQRAAYDDASAQAGESDRADTVDVAVDSSNARRKYLYVPYTLRDVLGEEAAKASEGALRAGAVGSATYRFTMDDVSASDMLADATWLESSEGSYASVESVYSAFCHEKYLAISEEDARAVKEYLFNDATWDDEAFVSDYAVISRVRTMMETLASYTTSPKAPDASVPFAEWLFGEARAGNSASFATAAVLAFRSQGIPARYAEGYRAAASDIANAAGEALSLDSGDVHAWAEVYLDGIGWTPVEVTPGFYAQSLEADSIIDVAEATSSGENEEVLQSGSVSGQVDEDEESPDAPVGASVPIGSVVAISVLGLAGAGILGIGAAFLQRAVRRSRRRERMLSDDQSVAVPALYRYLAVMLKRTLPAFSEERPLDAEADIAGVFPEIDPREYRRVISLHQAYTFGARSLKPHEMRTLRRFDERIRKEMPAAKTTVERLRRTFVDAL